MRSQPGRNCGEKSWVATISSKDPNKVTCSFCGMSFSDSSSLKRHGLVHQEGGNFPCDECGKVLKKKDSLKDHKRTHTGEKPFTCRSEHFFG